MLIDMLIDAEWCWLMVIDADLLLLMLIDSYWCWLILIDADWFWLMLIDSDWSWFLLIDSHWCWWMLIDADWCSNVQPGFLLLERTSRASLVIFIKTFAMNLLILFSRSAQKLRGPKEFLVIASKLKIERKKFSFWSQNTRLKQIKSCSCLIDWNSLLIGVCCPSKVYLILQVIVKGMQLQNIAPYPPQNEAHPNGGGM